MNFERDTRTVVQVRDVTIRPLVYDIALFLFSTTDFNLL